MQQGLEKVDEIQGKICCSRAWREDCEVERKACLDHLGWMDGMHALDKVSLSRQCTAGSLHES